MKFNMRNLFFFSMILTGVVSHVDAMNWRDHALPAGSMREKLNAIFSRSRDLDGLRGDRSWHNFGSMHWLVGKLTTAGGNTNFVVKAADHPAGETIVLVEVPRIEQIHTTQQNLSRIKRAAEVDRIIRDKGLTRIRTPKTWIYPLSGNDDDLANPHLTDHEVVIVEEMVSKKDDKMENMSQNPSIVVMAQEDALRLDDETYSELVTVAIEGRVLDLSPNNFLIDDQGKIVLIDLEDILAHEREGVEKSPFYVRGIKRFKFRCKEEASAKEGVGITGVLNRRSPELNQQGQLLRVKSILTLSYKRNAFEIGAVVWGISLMVRRVRLMRKTSRSIALCRRDIKTLVQHEQELHATIADSFYTKVASNVVKSHRPKETREEILNAFATIAMAENMEKEGLVTILGVQYASCPDAVKKSVALIRATWKSDWSIPSKIMRGAKATIRGARAFHTWMVKPAEIPAVA